MAFMNGKIADVVNFDDAEYCSVIQANNNIPLRPLKGLAHAKIIKKSVIFFWLLNITIWCKHVHRLELHFFLIFELRIHQLG